MESRAEAKVQGKKQLSCTIIRMAQTHSNECYFTTNPPPRRDITIISPVSREIMKNMQIQKLWLGRSPNYMIFCKRFYSEV
jgi:hypothetical protein